MATTRADSLFQSFVHQTGPESQYTHASHIPPAPFAPPPSIHRDIAVFEERLRSNLLYFKRKRQKYRSIQLGLAIVFCYTGLKGFLADEKRLSLLFQACAIVSVVALFFIGCQTDYHRTMEHARTTAHTYNLHFGHIAAPTSRGTSIPGLQFNDRVPQDVADGVMVERKAIQERMAARASERHAADGSSSKTLHRRHSTYSSSGEGTVRRRVKDPN
ncbi:hypothetical protein RI367_003957 [Sorochytrium milnesiophthora]